MILSQLCALIHHEPEAKPGAKAEGEPLETYPQTHPVDNPPPYTPPPEESERKTEENQDEPCLRRLSAQCSRKEKRSGRSAAAPRHSQNHTLTEEEAEEEDNKKEDRKREEMVKNTEPSFPVLSRSDLICRCRRSAISDDLLQDGDGEGW